jgi:deferrochelatase/peroxidase EfeB
VSGGRGVNRRRFLGGALGGVGLGAVSAAAPVVAAADAAAAPSTVPFHGLHQAGVVPDQQPHAATCAFDVLTQSPGELKDLFRTLTERARFLTRGGTPAPLSDTAPPSDSGTLGSIVVPDRLTVQVGLGATLFDDRYGLSSLRPRHLVEMRTFPNDDLQVAQSHGDLSLQLTADHQDTVLHALRDITKSTRGAMQLRWRLDGFTSRPRPSGTPRNHLGFRDGIANPDVDAARQMEDLVWLGPGLGEPAWAHDGTYLVVRLIRMLTEFWDRVSLSEQELMIGRRRASGAPLDGANQNSIPDYALDPEGTVIPLTAHIRLANPRTPQTEKNRILRRGYNYDLGLDDVGNLNMGLVFCCYQQDIARQFEAVQTRLIDEPLVDYVSPFGGGYFFVLPGVRDGSDYYGRSLFASKEE